MDAATNQGETIQIEHNASRSQGGGLAAGERLLAEFQPDRLQENFSEVASHHEIDGSAKVVRDAMVAIDKALYLRRDKSKMDATTNKIEAIQIAYNASRFQGGDSAASELLLAELQLDRSRGILPGVASQLELNGSAKIVRNAKGEPEHIIFNSADGKRQTDIDLVHDTVNGRNQPQLRTDMLDQEKRYSAAILSDPQTLNNDGKAFSPEAQAKAVALKEALREGDAQALQQIALEIMKDPTLTKDVQEELQKLDKTHLLNFELDADGNPLLKISYLASGAFIDISSKNGGGMTSNTPGFDPIDTIKALGDFTIKMDSSDIYAAMQAAEYHGGIPQEGTGDMQKLERAIRNEYPDYFERH